MEGGRRGGTSTIKQLKQGGWSPNQPRLCQGQQMRKRASTGRGNSVRAPPVLFDDMRAFKSRSTSTGLCISKLFPSSFKMHLQVTLKLKKHKSAPRCRDSTSASSSQAKPQRSAL